MVNQFNAIAVITRRCLLTLGLLLPPVLAQAQDVVVFFHTDAVGSVRVVTDATGAVIHRYDYLPFGEPWNPPPNADTRRFTGQELDAETMLNYFGARYYRPQSGLFITGDPGHVGGDIFNPQSWNAYSYALNNPLRFIDPKGTCSQDAKGHYFDSDDAGTLVARGPCRINNGALDAGVTDRVSVKAKTAIVALAEGISAGAGPIADAQFIAGFYATSAIVGGAGAVGSIAFSSGTLTTLGIGVAPLLPAVPSAIDKLQRIGVSVPQASRIATSLASQRFIDTANSNNINVFQQVGNKLVRITLDPSGQRIISAGYVQGRNVANNIASGRFIPQ